MTQTENTSYKDYIARIQALWQTPREVINQFVIETVEAKPIEYTRIMAGEANEVYSVRLDNNTDIIVRISRDGDRTFTKEKWAMQQCEKIGVPVAKLYGIKKLDLKQDVIELCSMEKLAGVPLRQLQRENNVSEEKTHEILKIVGKMLRRIHTIPTHGFGNINGRGEGKALTFARWVLKRTKHSENHGKTAKKHGIEEKSIIFILGELNKHEDLFTTISPHLVHGDVGTDHILVDGEKVTGIIDWGGAKSADAAYDFAWVHFFHEKKSAYNSLLEGYQTEQSVDENFNLRMHLCKLALILDQLYYYDMTGFEPGIAIVQRNIQEELEYFKNS